MPILLDLTPLRDSPAYRRLFTGLTLAGVGSQLTLVAIGLQVYELTGSSFSVGLVGLFALVPIIVMGLYGGALIDAHDRRTVALVASAIMWASGILTALQAWLGNTNPLVLYLLVAATSGGFAVVSPARSAIYPRLLERHLLPIGQKTERIQLGRFQQGFVHWVISPSRDSLSFSKPRRMRALTVPRGWESFSDISC